MPLRRTRAVHAAAAASVLAAAAAVLAAPARASVLVVPAAVGAVPPSPLLPAPPAVRQSAAAASVAASWALANGAVGGCPQTVVIDGAAAAEGGGVTTLAADALVVDGAACADGGRLAMLPGTADGVAGPTADVLRAADARFVFGIVSEPLSCGRWAWPTNTAAYFFGGEDALTVGAGDAAVELPAATRYLSVQFPDTTRRSCVYTASRVAEGRGEGGEGPTPTPAGGGGSDGVGGGEADASPSESAEPESACFPASATVEVAGRGSVAMGELALGDRVRVSASAWEPVVFFSHRDAAAVGAYVALTTASGRVLVATGGHLIYAADAAAAGGWGLKPASAVAVGDTLPLVSTDGGGAANASAAAAAGGTVVGVAPAAAAGFFNPHTPSGDLIVDGVRVSAYTTAVPLRVARALMGPVAAAASCGLVGDAAGGRALAGGAPRLAAAARAAAGLWASVAA
ncbi:hypothetical protein BU14_0515s0002 [Porphyra umbilicalis]|uniref:Hint domain-containing protein n=1 Tax=Porphyra umbilicalis TaxID=2786 RepID=A0A1X6NSV3_PORUM|nr:hypothetical protein BU14_0515s0002 [Porphyra umbilicalis]|eukprot:OSX71655.1 hypothetical protein BU14_0515s0002 [Porphyra umbilicalis]